MHVLAALSTLKITVRRRHAGVKRCRRTSVGNMVQYSVSAVFPLERLQYTSRVCTRDEEEAACSRSGDQIFRDPLGPAVALAVADWESTQSTQRWKMILK